MQNARWRLLRRATRSTLSTGCGPRRPMVAVEAGDEVHSLYRAETKTPVGHEAEAGRSRSRCLQHAIIICSHARCPQTPGSPLMDLIVPVV